MIKRNYFYQADTMSTDSKFMWGIITVRSWFPEPWEATNKIISNVKEKTGTTEDRQIKIVQFNRV